MSRRDRRLAPVLAALLPLCASCAHRTTRRLHLEPDVDAEFLPTLLKRHSNLPDPPPGRESPERSLPVPVARWKPSPPARHLGLGRRPDGEERDDLGPDPYLRRPEERRPTLQRTGRPPDDGDPAGRPAVDRPDKIEPVPTGGQPHYFSPASLKKVRKREQIPDGLAEGESADVVTTAEDLPGRRAEFKPAPTAPLDDEVPETGVADPTSLGSYHVQVATDPAFGRPVFDKTYTFMAEIDLERDLAVERVAKGRYWVRYSLIDLLEFQHPYSRPEGLVVSGIQP